MDRILIEKWNSVVTPNDTVIHLGDFSFKAGRDLKSNYISKLNGKIHLLMGNHDNYKAVMAAGFETVRQGIWDYKFYDNERKENRKVFLCHYPMISWNGSFHGRPHLFGHVHSGPRNHDFNKKQPNSYDVGVDNNDFYPVNMVDLINKMEKTGEVNAY